MRRKTEKLEIVRTTYATYVLKKIYCGKKNCGRCPHGPYWYCYITTMYLEKEGKEKERTIVKYVGKKFQLIKNDPGKIRSKWSKKTVIKKFFDQKNNLIII